MKKSVTFLILVVAALVVLTGCDALLEGFFPEFKNTNAIDVKYTAAAGPVVVALLPHDGGKIIEERILRISRPEKQFSVSFDGLPAGTYMVFVWNDANADGGATGEKGEYATPLGSPLNSFIFSEDDEERFYSIVADVSAAATDAPAELL